MDKVVRHLHLRKLRVGNRKFAPQPRARAGAGAGAFIHDMATKNILVHPTASASLLLQTYLQPP